MNKKHLTSIILSFLILSLFLIPYFNVSAKVTCNPNTLKPVKYGQKSLAVKNLQACLIEAGYNIPTGANGYYGIQTKKAVKKFYSEWYGNWSGNSIGQKGISKLKEKLLSKKQNLNSENCWAKAYRVIDKNEAYSISQTKDGGYILAGLMSPGKGADILVIKLDSDSNIQWAKTYREDSYDYGSYNAAYSISQTSDGGYILIGETNSLGTGSDILVIKLTSDGDIQWAKIYGGENFDSASLISPTQDGGYILIGTTNSFGAEGDILVIKLFFNGNIQWAKTYRAGDYDKVYSISRTKDGGYILAGYTNFLNTEKDNILVIKLDSDSNIQWAKTYGGSGDDWAHSIFQTQDGGYMLVGWTNSFDIAGALVIKLDSSGNIQWAKIYEGGNYNSAFLISPT
jgi:peptidoglycan hydrolase-like protein with peptidoglycan-binding domain